MAEKTASGSSSRKDNVNNNTNNNKRRHAVMLFGADISSPPPPTENNAVIQEQGNSIAIDIDSSNSVEASVINGILSDTNKAVGDKSSVVSFKRASKTGKAVHDRNKGKAWTEDEHLQFLAGLKKFGKGNWKNISRDFVPTRTPMQVASHAQKHFVRQSLSAKKPRSSIFDMTLADHAATSPASTSRDTSKAGPSPTLIVPAAEIRKEHPTPLPPYYLPVNPPLAAAAAAAAYGLPNYLGISYPVGFHYAGKSTTLTNSTMLNHPWIAYYYPKCSLV